MWLKNPPNPYPDETIGSVIGRWQMQTTEYNTKTTNHLLFGTQTNSVSLELSMEFTQLANCLDINADLLLSQHSILPFFASFHQDECSPATISKFMEKWPRFDRELRLAMCPLCVQDDFRIYGEPYWHRVHQLSTVLVCPKHNVTLVTTCAVCSEPLTPSTPNKKYPIIPTQCTNGHTLLSVRPNDNGSLFAIAQLTEHLLSGDLKILVNDLQEEFNYYLNASVFCAYPEIWYNKDNYLVVGGGFSSLFDRAFWRLASRIERFFGRDTLAYFNIQPRNEWDIFTWGHWLHDAMNVAHPIKGSPIHYILFYLYYEDFCKGEIPHKMRRLSEGIEEAYGQIAVTTEVVANRAIKPHANSQEMVVMMADLYEETKVSTRLSL